MLRLVAARGGDHLAYQAVKGLLEWIDAVCIDLLSQGDETLNLSREGDEFGVGIRWDRGGDGNGRKGERRCAGKGAKSGATG
jgi:hypothetical protein